MANWPAPCAFPEAPAPLAMPWLRAPTAKASRGTAWSALADACSSRSRMAPFSAASSNPKESNSTAPASTCRSSHGPLPAAGASDKAVRGSSADLARIGLNPVDQLQMASVLTIFNSQDAAFLQKYENQPPDENMVPYRDRIVTETITRLQNTLSPEGFQMFRQFIQHEKTRMKSVAMPKMGAMS